MTYSTGYVQSAFHASREILGVFFLSVNKSYIFERVVDRFLKFLALDSVKRYEQLRILPCLQTAVYRKLLRNVADPANDLFSVSDSVFPEQLHSSRCGTDKRTYHVHGGAFSCPVWPEKPEYLAFSDLKRKVIHNCFAAVLFCEFVRSEYNIIHLVCLFSV